MFKQTNSYLAKVTKWVTTLSTALASFYVTASYASALDSTTGGTTIQSMAQNITTQLAALTGPVATFSVVAGTCLFGYGLFAFYKHIAHPNPQNSIGKPIMATVTGALFFFTYFLANSAAISVTGSNAQGKSDAAFVQQIGGVNTPGF